MSNRTMCVALSFVVFDECAWTCEWTITHCVQTCVHIHCPICGIGMYITYTYVWYYVYIVYVNMCSCGRSEWVSSIHMDVVRASFRISIHSINGHTYLCISLYIYTGSIYTSIIYTSTLCLQAFICTVDIQKWSCMSGGIMNYVFTLSMNFIWGRYQNDSGFSLLSSAVWPWVFSEWSSVATGRAREPCRFELVFIES